MTPTNVDMPDELRSVLSSFPEFQPTDYNHTGANGYVVLGWHRKLRRRVTVKVYFHSDGQVTEEPATIAEISHPNVLTVLDARKLGNECSYFVTPTASGGDLGEYLRDYFISLPFAHTLLCQLLSGIAALHAKPHCLVHRDLKPQNILVHEDALLIADFGSVQRVDSVTKRATASMHSILYRPPETFGTDAHYDNSSDVYQAGLIGYVLFGGVLPDDLRRHMNTRELKQLDKLSETEDEFTISHFVDSCVQKRIKTSKLADFSKLPCFVPSSIVRVLKKSMSQTDRYISASQFLFALNNARADLPHWIALDNKMRLYGWKKNDYEIRCDAGRHIAFKKSRGAKAYRRDNSIKSSPNVSEVFRQLKSRIGLP